MPGCFTTAPHAVVIPQPNKQTFSSGAFGLTATTETSATTVYWEKVEVPICHVCHEEQFGCKIVGGAQSGGRPVH